MEHLINDNLIKFAENIWLFNKGTNLISKKLSKKELLDQIEMVSEASKDLLGLIKSNHIKNIYDFGSGNGIPGIILGILTNQLNNLDINIELIDSEVRKVEFLKTAIHRLKLKQVSASCLTINKNIKILENSMVISRGYNNLSTHIKELKAIKEQSNLKKIYFGTYKKQFVKDELDNENIKYLRQTLQINNKICLMYGEL